MNYDCVIIGSSFAGIATAYALLEGGRSVLMIDGGQKLEEERIHKIQDLRKKSNTLWTPKDIQFLKEGMEATTSGVTCKRVYGSLYPYEKAEIQPINLKNAKVIRSFAVGGLSSVWGASILPMHEDDMEDWPITINDLAPYYQKVLRILPHSMVKDDIEKCFPLYSEHATPFNLSNQASYILQSLQKNIDPRERSKFIVGRSRLAVDNKTQQCIYCGLCLYGCPYGLIYNTESSLKRLFEMKNFEYRAKTLVTHFEEKNNHVQVFVEGGHQAEIFANKVYLAAGVVSTARIMLKSMGWYDRPVKMMHSDHFQVPMITQKKHEMCFEEKLHTLAQLYLMIKNDKVSRYWVNMQLYTYNDLYEQVLDLKLKKIPENLRSILKSQLSGRLSIIKGYLHSKESSHLSIHLSKKDGVLNVAGFKNNHTPSVIRKVGRILFSIGLKSGVYPIIPAMHLGVPGEGNHSGGTFPMSENPKEGESDFLGRPQGFENVHIVDASCFSSVTATTIAFTSMANASRIASLSV